MPEDSRKTKERRILYLPGLVDTMARECPRSAHYHGIAHLEIFRVLLRYMPVGRITAMDVGNQFGLETEFDFDTGERIHEHQLPAELEGVRFYIEGAAPAELLISDWRSTSPDSLCWIVKNRGHQPPRLIFLARAAMKVELPSEYDWTQSEDYLLGMRTAPYRNHHPRFRWDSA